MTYDSFHDFADHDVSSDGLHDPGHIADVMHSPISESQYQQEMNHALYELNDTNDTVGFMNDINHLIDEITAPPDFSHLNQHAGADVPHTQRTSFDATSHPNPVSGGIWQPEHHVPSIGHPVGYDENGHWWSWGIDTATGLPTFAPDPKSFEMPISFGSTDSDASS